MVSDFAKLLKDLLVQVANGIGSTISDWDRKSYESVVNCLLLRDEIAVKEAVDHLVSEGKALAIPPVYLASQRHHSLTVRQYCWQALGKLDSHTRINRVVQGKDLHNDLESLIEEYGHFRDDYH